MNINFEKVPTIFFEWMKKYSFKELNDSQKKEVLTFFSEVEFDEMHQTLSDLKSVSDIKDIRSSSDTKNKLLNHFDKRYATLQKSSHISGVIMWQAAAILLLLLCGWLFYQVFDLQKNNNITQIAVTDTVYVDREVSCLPEIIHDTVYRYKQTNNSSGERTHSVETRIMPEAIGAIGEMEMQSVLEFENLRSTPRGNSMKDDSLLRKFTFVSM